MIERIQSLHGNPEVVAMQVRPTWGSPVRVRLAGVALLALAHGLSGCHGSGSPSTPSTQSPAPPAGSSPPAQPVVSGISGFVLDTGFRPIAGARVEVVDGAAVGTSTTTDEGGRFSLAGTFDGTTRFRATKEGHVAATQTWNCSDGGCSGPGAATPWLGFYLAVLAPSVDLAGAYSLTFVADSACPDLPSEMRTRTYGATITAASSPSTPVNTAFEVTVGGAPFLGSLSGFEIGVAGDHVGFWLHGGHDPALVERVADSAYLAFSGVASASVTASTATITTSFDGWIEYCVMKSEMGQPYNCGTSNRTGEPIPGRAVTRAHCESKDHRLILTRR